jgi:hypothetical protein
MTVAGEWHICEAEAFTELVGGVAQTWRLFSLRPPKKMSVSLVPVVFRTKGARGDFEHMMQDPHYDDAVFVFNDNVVDASTFPVCKGAASAVVRPRSLRYSSDATRSCSIGIPTGWSSLTGGFKVSSQEIEAFACRAIVLEVERLLIHAIGHPHIKRIIYSCDENDTSRIGQSVFKLPDALVDFIMAKLRALPERIRLRDTKFTAAHIDELNTPIAVVARLHNKIALRETTTVGVKRVSSTISPSRGLVVLPARLGSREESRRGLIFIGFRRNGEVVYEQDFGTCPYFF